MTRQEQLQVYVAKHTTNEIKNELKRILLKDKRKLLKEYNRISNKIFYYREINYNVFMQELYLNKRNDLLETIDYMRYRLVLDDVVNSLNASKRGKNKRIKARVTSMILNDDAYFYTLTFEDEVFETTSEDTRRQYVRKFLKANSTSYVANLDYGEDYGREHYHAIANAFINEKLWPYGIMRVRKIGNNTVDLKRMSHYVTKLSFHAIKDTTLDYSNKFRLIYSRN